MTFIVLDRAMKRLRNKGNYVAGIIGPVGAGKSWCGLRFCEYIDSSFKHDFRNRCYFDVLDLFKFINSHPKDTFKGRAFLLEEGGVSLSHKEQLSITNRSFGKLLQSWRYLQAALFITSPSLSFLDKTARGLLNNIFSVRGYNSSLGKSVVFAYDNKLNPFKGDSTRPFPTTRIGTRSVTIKKLHVGRPSKGVRISYGQMAAREKQRIGREGMVSIERMRAKEQRLSDKNVLHDAVLRMNKTMKPYQISKMTGVPNSTIQYWIKNQKIKGG